MPEPLHCQVVIQMNEVRGYASEWVQRAIDKVISMIDEPGQTDRSAS
jgi:hypothetical protein